MIIARNVSRTLGCPILTNSEVNNIILHKSNFYFTIIVVFRGEVVKECSTSEHYATTRIRDRIGSTSYRTFFILISITVWGCGFLLQILCYKIGGVNRSCSLWVSFCCEDIPRIASLIETITCNSIYARSRCLKISGCRTCTFKLHKPIFGIVLVNPLGFQANRCIPWFCLMRRGLLVGSLRL